MIGFPRRFLPVLLALTLLAVGRAAAQAPLVGDAAQGKAFFAQSCALCHAAELGPGNIEIIGQGPSLAGVFGRAAGNAASFPYSSALSSSKLTWDVPTLDKFLTDPGALVPGTKMLVAISDPQVRANLIAYLQTLKVPENVKLAAAPTGDPAVPVAKDPGAWQNAAPGVAHHITVADLPPPFTTTSIDNSVRYVKPPGDEDLQTTPATLAAPPGFTVKLFAKGLSNPRCLRVAPNGDIFLAETGANRIHVFPRRRWRRHAHHRPGLRFEPRSPLRHRVLPSREKPQVGLRRQQQCHRPLPLPQRRRQGRAVGGRGVEALRQSRRTQHARHRLFHRWQAQCFISVGSSTQIGEGIEQKSSDEIKAWEAQHGLGAAWGFETNRADVLVTDPEGKTPLHAYATGIRNGVGIAVNPRNGDLWTSVNERDGLGDNLVPDYITRVREGAFYGWPWFYLGNTEDPRWKGVRPDLAGKVTAPDVLVQAHSASLEMCFYTATRGTALFPPGYRGDIFAAEHGSFNRHNRTGYKVIRVRLKNGVPTGEYDDFLTGFVVDDTSAWGRPVGVAVAHDGALLVSEDDNSSLWRVSYHAPQVAVSSREAVVRSAWTTSHPEPR
ncbi:MAG: PQQ-dependent sugar dehydrogenase [Verrucomicrobiota bacterium]